MQVGLHCIGMCQQNMVILKVALNVYEQTKLALRDHGRQEAMEMTKTLVCVGIRKYGQARRGTTESSGKHLSLEPA
jgi:hypothetical protein